MHVPEIDCVLDSLPVMLTCGEHAYTARVARETADLSYCASNKQHFHGVRLHVLGQRRAGWLPCPQQIWLREASCHDLRSLKEQAPELPTTTLFADSAYADSDLREQLAAQGASLRTPKRKPTCAAARATRWRPDTKSPELRPRQRRASPQATGLASAPWWILAYLRELPRQTRSVLLRRTRANLRCDRPGGLPMAATANVWSWTGASQCGSPTEFCLRTTRHCYARASPCILR
jgi:hypothetical protein